jgi:hypothetical protein
MLIFIVVGLTAFVCNLGQGQCIQINSGVMVGVVAAGVLELMFESFGGFVKIFKKKDNDDEQK